MKLFAWTDMGPEEVTVTPKGRGFRVLFEGSGWEYTIPRLTLTALNRAIEKRAERLGEMNWRVTSMVKA